MSLPIGLSTVTVAAGPYTDAEGVPYSGAVTFTPSTSVAWAATGQVILDGPVTVALDSTGAASIVLPATDAAGLTVSGFTYRVSYALMAGDRTRTGYRHPYSIQLPHASATAILENLAPLTASDGSTVSVAAVTSVAGLTGAVPGSALSTALNLGPAATFPLAGTPMAGQVITATSGTAASWQTPSQGSVVSDATTSSKGIVQLAGDLAGTAAAPTVPGLAAKATDSAVVHNTGAETVAGVKTFTSAPVVPSGAFPESAVSGLTADLASKAPTSRAITAGTGLTGGGDLTADRTLTVAYGTTSSTAARGDDARITGAAQKSANLSDLADPSAARTSLGLGTAATQAATAFEVAGAAATAQAASLQKSSNLSDVASAATARTNLGLGTAATQASSAFDAAGAASTVQAASLQKSANLSDLASTATARTNLGVGASTQVDIYATAGNYVWTLPTGAKSVRFQVWAGGGGGGSGRRGAAGTIRCAGGGGGGGSYSEQFVSAANLPSSLNVVVGAAGAGGAAQSVDSTDGAPGSAGGSSGVTSAASIATAVTSGGFRVGAGNGGAGSQGTASSGFAGSAGGGQTANGGGGGAGSASGGGGGGGIASTSVYGGGGGSGGGGINAADTPSSGANGVARTLLESTTAGGSVGGGSGSTAYTPPIGTGGAQGGAGGGASINSAAGAGAAGGFPGGGGGGGGASLNGNPSGAGGAGGAGLVVITTWF